MFRLKKNPLFKDYNVWTTKMYSCLCDIINCKSRLLKFDWLAGEKNALSATRFTIEPQRECFYITVFLMETNCFQKMLGHFHFILHVISDNAAFVSGALFCVQRYRGNLELSRWQIINLHIYTATNSASLWDYGRNNFNGNSFSAIHVIMLELKNNKHNTFMHLADAFKEKWRRIKTLWIIIAIVWVTCNP